MLTGLSEIDKSGATYLTDCGVIMKIPNIVFLLQGGNNIVIDTSFESVERSKAVHDQTVWRTKEQEVDYALKNIGVDPSQVDIVIFTHLHYDHCGTNKIFTNARFIVQREELTNALVPTRGQETAYFSPIIGETPSFSGTKFDLIDGEVEIFEGINVIKTPGHTPGSQAILVNTSDGIYCVAGDAVPFYENIEKDIPAGYHDCVHDCYESMDKIKRMSKEAIPAHDPLIFKDGSVATFPQVSC